MVRRASFLGVALLVSGSAASGADETPIEWFKRLMAPPIAAVTETFRPVGKAAAAPTPFDVPTPRLRAGIADPETTAATAPLAAPPLLSYAPDNATLVPVPAPRPAAPFDAVASLPDARLPELTRPPPAAQSTCGVALANLGVRAMTMAPIEEGDCGVAAPVAVAALDGGVVALPTRAIVECATAERFAAWLADTVQPKARSIFGAPVTGLRVAASYACRNRNGLADARLSEHAKGKAVDVSAFRVGGRWIDVKSGWQAGDDDTTFLKAVRKSACGPFKTVLGPGTDKYHSDHFHLDVAERRNGRTYCR